eukprot:jgi/Mesvir1/26737/Mv20513-RA.1
MSYAPKPGYDWFEDLVNTDPKKKSVKTSKSLAPSTVVHHMETSDDDDSDRDAYEEKEKKISSEKKSSEKKEVDRDDRDEPVKRYVRTTYRTDPSSVRHPGLKDVLVRR